MPRRRKPRPHAGDEVGAADEDDGVGMVRAGCQGQIREGRRPWVSTRAVSLGPREARFPWEKPP
ncbi:MAG TPA: hypothetical protein VFA95_14785 [Gammaproteobacteria bacterium]|nr:hypothetical protein [Gammaproteobacteria bacterium]